CQGAKRDESDMKGAPGSLHPGQSRTRGRARPSPGRTGPEGAPWTPGTRNPEPGTRNPEPGTRNPEPGTRNPEPGAPDPVADGPAGAGRQSPYGQPAGPSAMPVSRRDRNATNDRHHHQNRQERGVPRDHRHRYSPPNGDKRHREVRGHGRPRASEGRRDPAAPPPRAADPACPAVDITGRAVRGPVAARLVLGGRVPTPPPHPPAPQQARDRCDRERTR